MGSFILTRYESPMALSYLILSDLERSKPTWPRSLRFSVVGDQSYMHTFASYMNVT